MAGGMLHQRGDFPRGTHHTTIRKADHTHRWFIPALLLDQETTDNTMGIPEGGMVGHRHQRALGPTGRLKEILAFRSVANTRSHGQRPLFRSGKLYDTIDPRLVITKALQLGYPVIQLWVSIQIHTACRVLTAGKQTSRLLYPLISIIAGCGRSISFTRAVLYDMLEEAH